MDFRKTDNQTRQSVSWPSLGAGSGACTSFKITRLYLCRGEKVSVCRTHLACPVWFNTLEILLLQFARSCQVNKDHRDLQSRQIPLTHQHTGTECFRLDQSTVTLFIK